MLNFKIVESQKLVFSKGPVIAADTTALNATFEVGDLFTGTLTAYWNVRGSAVDPFTVELDEEKKCLIPAEVLATIADPDMYGDIDHILQVSIVSKGDDDTVRITSSVCELPVYKSTYSGNTSQPSKPSGSGNVTNIITGAAVNGEQLNFYNGNNIIFSTPLENLKTFLLPLSGGTMTGVLNMGGNAIQNLPDAVNDGDALALAFAKTLFAPSGHGLGQTKSVWCDDLNKNLANGYYWIDSDTANRPSGLSPYAMFTVVHRTANEIIEDIKDVNGLHCIRRSSDGGTTWVEEWENPPMVLGVEYRTTKRYNGLPVYAKAVYVSPLVVGVTYVNDIATGVTNCVSSVFNTYVSGMSVIYQTGDIKTTLTNDGSLQTLKCGIETQMSDTSGILCVEYTK